MMHGSNSVLNLRLTLQQHLRAALLAKGETFPVLYGKRDPAALKAIDTAAKWMSFRLITGGTWLPGDAALMQMLIYTRLESDPYEIELDRLTDLSKEIFDVAGGLDLKDYRTNRLNPTVVVDPIDEVNPIKLNIRYYDMDEIPSPVGTNEMLNGRALSFRVWFWRHSESGV